VIAYETTESLAFHHAINNDCQPRISSLSLAANNYCQPPTTTTAGAEAITQQNSKSSSPGVCYYRRVDGPWKARKELNSLFIGERLFASRLLESDLLDGKSGAKVFLDCGIGKINKRGKWSIVNGMVRVAKKGMKASVVRKKLKKIPLDTLIEVYVSKIRVEEGTFEVCVSQNEALEKGSVERSKVPASSLKEGEELTGFVKNVTPYGVFVDVNANRNGLIHISKVANRQDKYVNKEEGLKQLGLGRGSPVNVIVLSNEKKRLELDLAPVREEIPVSDDEDEDEDEDSDDISDPMSSNMSEDEADAWAAYGDGEGSTEGDNNAISDDDEAAMWAAYAAPDYSTSNEDEEEEDDEDKDIEDSMGIGNW